MTFKEPGVRPNRHGIRGLAHESFAPEIEPNPQAYKIGSNRHAEWCDFDSKWSTVSLVTGLKGKLAASLFPAICLGLFTLSAIQNAGATSTAPQAPDFEKNVKPVLQTFCASCHTGPNAQAGINPTQYRSMAEVQKAGKEFERILVALKAGTMPPPNAKQLTANERKKLIADLEAVLTGDCKLPDPGRVTIRRLNKTEYTNTIRDLTGIEFKRTDDFPSDDVGYGFDNIGDVLSISPLLLEKYLYAAEQIADEAIVAGVSKAKRYEGSDLLATEGRTFTLSGESVIFAKGGVYIDHAFTIGGTYRLGIKAYGQQAGPDPCRIIVSIDGKPQPPIDVPQKEAKPGDFDLPITIAPGKRRIQVDFANDFYNPNDPDPNNRDRNLIVCHIEVSGSKTDTLDYATLPETHRRIVPAPSAKGKEMETGRQQLTAFASRAFRRPPTSEEIERVMAVFKMGHDNKETFERCMQLGVTAILTSPHFLFRVEPQTKPGSELSSYQMASRLSYFLWSSMPDKALFDLAAQDKLRSPLAIKEQVDRMLADPRAETLTTNFGSQWLQIPKFMNANPDRRKYGSFNPQIKNAMRQEALATFRYVFFNDRPLTEFLDGNYVVVNDQLAFFYGIPDVTGKEFKRVEVDPNLRGGIVSLGAVMTLTSNPNRTSPTKRGKWILEQVLGTPPPPPPPGADQLPETPKGQLPKSIREQLEVHRSNPDCASCHALLDPMGFSLENFDGTGVFRYKEGEERIDPTGELADGTKFKGLGELKKVLVSKKDQFTRAFGEKLLTYSLGRGLTLADNCALDEILAAAKKNEYRPRSMIHAIVQTDAFRKQGN